MKFTGIMSGEYQLGTENDGDHELLSMLDWIMGITKMLCLIFHQESRIRRNLNLWKVVLEKKEPMLQEADDIQ